MTRLPCVLVILLAACPAPAPSPTLPAQPGQPGVGCPAATDVHVASYLTRDEQGAAAPGGGHTGWVLPLHDLPVATLAGQPEYTTLDATTAGALGVPAAPANAWLMAPGQPPCKLTIGAYYGAAVESPTANVTYGVELTGCAAPPADQQHEAQAIVLVSDRAPSECQVLRPRPVAARLGDTDAQKRWRRPTQDTPIPPALAAAVPVRACRPPSCEALWSIAQVDVANQPVAWAGAVNWLTVKPDAPPTAACPWTTESFAGFFVAGPDGKAVKVTEGQDHPLLLTAVLADRGGARALVAEGAGEYATYDLIAGAATLARHLVWLILAPEAYAIDERLGC